MRIKYVGPKASISHSSITFDSYKQDKFIYINIAYHLLMALDHDYGRSAHYVDTINSPRMNTQELEQLIIPTGCFDDSCINHRQEKLLLLFENEINRIKNNPYLSTADKEVYLKNHALMKEYRQQREVNKSVYYMLIKRLVSVINSKRIEYIITPVHERFTYVLDNLQNTLLHDKKPVFTKLIMYEESGEFKTKLQVSQI